MKILHDTLCFSVLDACLPCTLNDVLQAHYSNERPLLGDLNGRALYMTLSRGI
jgi:hypothetical protein